MMGVPAVDYFVNKLGGGKPHAAFEKIYEAIASGDTTKTAHAWAIAQRARGEIDVSRQSHAEPEKIEAVAFRALREMLAAGPTTRFDLTYPAREVIVEKLIGYREYARDTMIELAQEGVGYSEQSVGLGKLDKFNEKTMREIHGQLAKDGKAVDVRFLAMVHTSALRGEASAKNVAETKAKLEQVLARGDVIGIDIAGPETGAFTPDGMKTFEGLYAVVSAAAHHRGRPMGSATARRRGLRRAERSFARRDRVRC